MISETDWELGLPPYGVHVQAFIRGHVRTGKRDYGGTFKVNGCTHPQQNTTFPLEWVEAWKYRHKNSEIAEFVYATSSLAIEIGFITGMIGLWGYGL